MNYLATFYWLQETFLTLLTFSSHVNIRLHLDLSIVWSNHVPDLVGPLLIRMNHVILPKVLAHKFRMCVQAAPIVRIVCKDIAYIFVVFSSSFFKQTHLHIGSFLFSFDLSDRAIILFWLLILIGRRIANIFRSSGLALRFNFGIAFRFYEFADILQVWKLEFSWWTLFLRDDLLNRSMSIWLDPALVICRRWVQCCMLRPDRICCRARASVIIHGPETFNLVTIALSAPLLTYRLSLHRIHANSTVGCGLSRSLVADVSISIIMIRDISETVLYLQQSHLILFLLLIAWINHACKMINVVYAWYSICWALLSVRGDRFLHCPKLISFS